MELHTLGVDGGYTQKDVTEAARVLTGWSVYPMGVYRNKEEQLKRLGRDSLKQEGFVHKGDFVFYPARHDKGDKTVLGVHFPANGGYEEGVNLLSMLAHSKATAAFICRKLAVRFVSDAPPESLVNKMVTTFIKKDGDIREVLMTMVTAPEFWAQDAVRSKTKSPFELAISTVRTLNINVARPNQLFKWIDRMGEKIYYYQAPTGFPDNGQYWINSGALLNRMNFGLAIATGRIPGVQPDLLGINNGHEPESVASALSIYGNLLMPERDLAPTIKRITPMINEPDLLQKVSAAADKAQPEPTNAKMDDQGSSEFVAAEREKPAIKKKEDATLLAREVGVLIGSPEFQRR